MKPPDYKRPAALGPMPAAKMPRKLRRPSLESPLDGLARFLKHHWAAPKLAPASPEKSK